jgi:hypothetical protein
LGSYYLNIGLNLEIFKLEFWKEVLVVSFKGDIKIELGDIGENGSACFGSVSASTLMVNFVGLRESNNY